MSHLQKISWILGSLLLGASAVIALQRNQEGRTAARVRRANEPPVEELADHLKAAWAGYHTP